MESLMAITGRTDNKTLIIRVTGLKQMRTLQEKENRSNTTKKKIVLIIKVAKIRDTTTPLCTSKKKLIPMNSQSNEVWQQTKLS